MKSKIAMVAATLLIATGASQVRAQIGPPCSGPNHCVDIVIAGGVIQPVRNVVVAAANHQIYWHIRTSGYSFPPPPHAIGVVFKEPSTINDNGRMPPNEFPCNRVSATVLHCTDRNSTHGAVRAYQYAITVVDGAGRKIESDPWVVNR